MTQYSMDGGFFSLQELIPNHAKSTLVVGDMARWKTQGRNLPEMEGLKFIDLDALTVEVLQDQKPDIILSPLVSEDFAAVDVAAKLGQCRGGGGCHFRYQQVSVFDADRNAKKTFGYAQGAAPFWRQTTVRRRRGMR